MFLPPGERMDDLTTLGCMCVCMFILLFCYFLFVFAARPAYVCMYIYFVNLLFFC